MLGCGLVLFLKWIGRSELRGSHSFPCPCPEGEGQEGYQPSVYEDEHERLLVGSVFPVMVFMSALLVNPASWRTTCGAKWFADITRIRSVKLQHTSYLFASNPCIHSGISARRVERGRVHETQNHGPAAHSPGALCPARSASKPMIGVLYLFGSL